MKLSAPIYRLKRQAKILARQTDKPLNQTLDTIARQEGYRSWSHLSAKAGAKSVAVRLLDRLQPG